MTQLGDITKLSGYAVAPADVVTGGSPCQDLSIAGKRAGLAGARSGLFMEQIRMIKEMRDADRKRGRTGVSVRPRFMVWENVPGAFSSNGGEDFRAVLEETIRVAEPDAPDVPLPAKGKWPLADAWYGDGWSVAYRVLDAQFWGVPQRRRRIALVADFGGRAAPEILFVRQSVQGDIDESGAAREEAAGSAGSGAAAASGCLNGWDVQSKRVFDPSSVCGTLNSGTTEGMNIVPLVLYPQILNTLTALCVGNGQTNNISMAEQVNTLDTMHDQQAVLVSHALTPWDNQARRCYSEIAVMPSLSSRENAGQSQQSILTAGIVRRLTPLECERLQGYPDGWTDIGEWTDSKGKRHREADSPRYKALGNSIALPPWTWVLKRIAACYERPATLASLFDGIGGFPLIWERLNGKDTALWASEIEEFAIAVTKRHFPEEGAE